MGIPATLSSVPAQTPYIQYVATAGQTVYPYPFEITQDSDLIVVYNGTTLSTDQGYTLSGQGNSTGGNVTFTTGANFGDIVTLYRDIAIERLTQIGQNSGFSSSAFNAEFNNIYLILQQLQQSGSLALQIPNTNNPAPVTTLTPGNYANKYLAFDSNGNPEPAVLTNLGSLTASIINALTQPRTTAESSANVTPSNIFYPTLNVLRYGADPTGTNDSTTAFENAIAVAAVGGGIVYMPSGVYKISSTLNVNSPGVYIQGAGYNSFHDGGTPTYPVKVLWTGSASGVVFKFDTLNVSSNSIIAGCGLSYVYIEGNAVAGTGLYVGSVRQSDFNHIYVKNVTAQAYMLYPQSSVGAAEATDLQDCVFSRCTWRNIDLSGAQGGHGFVLTNANPGPTNAANVSFNRFEHCGGECYNGINWILGDADNNQFFGCRAGRVNGTSVPGLSIRGADTNTFYDFSCGGTNGIAINGTASGYFANPVSNSFFSLDDSNDTLPPTYDANCRATVHQSISGWNKNWNVGGIFSDNATTAQSEWFNFGTETLRVRNGSQNHVVLTDGTHTGGVNIDSSGNLRLTISAGSGGTLIDTTKIGLYNVSPVAQATTSGSASSFVANSGTTVNSASTFDGYTLGQVVKALRNIGVLT